MQNAKYNCKMQDAKCNCKIQNANKLVFKKVSGLDKVFRKAPPISDFGIEANLLQVE